MATIRSGSQTAARKPNDNDTTRDDVGTLVPNGGYVGR